MDLFLWFMFQFEEAAGEVADELTSPRPEGEENVEDIQILLSSSSIPVPLRSLKVNLSLFLMCYAVLHYSIKLWN